MPREARKSLKLNKIFICSLSLKPHVIDSEVSKYTREIKLVIFSTFLPKNQFHGFTIIFDHQPYVLQAIFDSLSFISRATSANDGYKHGLWAQIDSIQAQASLLGQCQTILEPETKRKIGKNDPVFI